MKQRNGWLAFFGGMLVMALIFTLATPVMGAGRLSVLQDVLVGGIRIVLDGEELQPKDVNGNTVEPMIYRGTTYLPVRAVGEALGLEVGWDGSTYTVTLDGPDSPAKQQFGGAEQQGEQPVKYERRRVSTSAGAVTLNILTIDIKNPRVRLTPALGGGALCERSSLKSIVARAGEPKAVFTANFMSGDAQGNYPVGHLMIDGEMAYTGSGISSLGILEDGSVVYGRPDIRAHVVPEKNTHNQWNATAINIPEKNIADNLSVLYTPYKGKSVTVSCAGTAMTAESGVVTAFERVQAGDSLTIPADGFVYFMVDKYMSYTNGTYRSAVVGERVSVNYYIESDAESSGFTLKNLRHIISGGPRLVRDGRICTELEPQFSGSGFTSAASARTCIGSTADGKLIAVNTDSATIQAMREAMLALGCVNAFNMDGGASAAMYYDGSVLHAEGRELAHVVQVFVD